MTLENLATARDWAVIILAIQAIVVAAVVVFIAWHTYRAMRRARPKVEHGLHDARHAVIHVSEGARRGVLTAARPFVWVDSARTGVQVGWASWWRGRAPFVHRYFRRR